MFDSSSQRELRLALPMWLTLKGLGLVTGPSGVGKSIYRLVVGDVAIEVTDDFDEDSLVRLVRVAQRC